MPKIIFRPNPTPPPFDPPTPPVQNPSVFFNPYPFEPDTPIHAVLTNLTLPSETNVFSFEGYVEQWQDVTALGTYQVSGSPSTIEVDGAFEASSAQISRYYLECFHVEGSEWTPLGTIDLELLN